MKKIFVQNLPNKFINNLIQLNYPKATFASGSTKNILYKLNDQYNFDQYIFVLSLLDHEILQFVIEYKHKIKFFLFHNIEIMDNNFIAEYGSLFHHLTYKTINAMNQYLLPANLVNTDLYKRDKNITKDDSIVFFMDEYNNIPQDVEQNLYPNTKMKIKLFNGLDYKHPQHLGMLSEQQKVYILNKASYFISNNKYYEQEASLCGCKIIDSNNINIDEAYTVETNLTPYAQVLDAIL